MTVQTRAQSKHANEMTKLVKSMYTYDVEINKLREKQIAELTRYKLLCDVRERYDKLDKCTACSKLWPRYKDKIYQSLINTAEHIGDDFNTNVVYSCSICGRTGLRVYRNSVYPLIDPEFNDIIRR